MGNQAIQRSSSSGNTSKSKRNVNSTRITALIRKRTSGFSSKSADSKATENSSTVYDHECDRVDNEFCCHGSIQFSNGASFQGFICNHMIYAMDPLETMVDMGPATFNTPEHETIQGVWRFIRFGYDIESESPVAIYEIQGHVFDDGGHAPIAYNGPACIFLKLGIIRLTISPALLSSGKEALKNPKARGTPSTAPVFDNSPTKTETKSLSRKEIVLAWKLHHRHSSYSNVIRNHRLLFYRLCESGECATTKWDSDISSDLQRTHFNRFVDRSPMVAKSQLYSILRYLAIAFPQIGYCQGMHCIAKYFLLFSEAPIVNSMGEADTLTLLNSHHISIETETAFVMFAQTLEDPFYCLADLFAHDLAFFRKTLAIIDAEIAKREPVLYEHLVQHGVTASVYASRWILTVFTFYADHDFTSVTHIWLMYLVHGWSAVVQVAISCVISVKEFLLNGDTESCLVILSGKSSATPHGLLEHVLGSERGQMHFYAGEFSKRYPEFKRVPQSTTSEDSQEPPVLEIRNAKPKLMDNTGKPLRRFTVT